MPGADRVVDTGTSDYERHVAVLRAVAAVRGDLGGLARVDDAVLVTPMRSGSRGS